MRGAYRDYPVHEIERMHDQYQARISEWMSATTAWAGGWLCHTRDTPCLQEARSSALGSAWSGVGRLPVLVEHVQ